MKKYSFLSLFLFFTFLSFGQCPTTDIVLNSQNDIDNFAINYPNCTALTHELRIEGDNGFVTNLEGLSLLTSAQFLFILNTDIENFNGLHNLESISKLSVWFNVGIQNLEGLSSVQNMGYLELFLNANLEDLSGMNNIQTLNNINFFGNYSLEDLNELSFIQIMNSITLGGNNLNTLSGLENLTKVTGDININHEQIENLDEFTNLQIIGGSLHIMFNSELKEITALSNIESLVDFYILECTNLINLNGLNNLHTVSGKLRIGFNSELEDILGLININSIGELEIYENENLKSLKGLESLREIQQRLLVNNNPILRSIEHISDVIPNYLNRVIIVNNPNLSICNNPFICTITETPFVSKTFLANAPGCSSVQEVELSCLLSMEETVLELKDVKLINQLVFYPNPVSETLTISLTENITFKKAIVFSVLGEKLVETSEKNINFSNMVAGIYFVDIETDKGNVFKKIIKE